MRTANAVGKMPRIREDVGASSGPGSSPPPQYLDSSIVGLMLPDYYASCLVCTAPATESGFCVGCLAGIEGDVWMEDIAPRRARTGRIYYGTSLPDRFR